MDTTTTDAQPAMRRSLMAVIVGMAAATIVAGSATPAAIRIGTHPKTTQILRIDNGQTANSTPLPSEEIPIPAALVDPDLDLRAPARPVPLRLKIPSVAVDVPVLGTGLVPPNNSVDAPKGPPDDPVWREAFWYRGSGIPGDSGVANIAGHVDDSLGRVDPFYQLRNLKVGDQIMVQDTRPNGPTIYFKVFETTQYTEKEASTPENLARIYGDGPANGRGPQPSRDGQSYLTLLTCAGDFVNGSFDHRMVVFAVRYLP